MNFESSRLRTFHHWPSMAPVSHECLAKAGFYYVGNFEVQCFSCGGRISEWHFGDKIMAKHRLLDPRCPFIVNPADSGNVPINDADHQSVDGSSDDVNKEPTSNEANNEKAKYKTESARLETFDTWPIPSKVEGFRLAKAGFYYLQELDKVRCAFCGIDAFEWEAGDDPIMEHRKYSPTCPFLSNLSVGCSSQNSNDVIVLRDDYFCFEPEYGLDATHMKDFGILNHRIPKHPKFMTEESRISSFEKWPKKSIKDPLELAKAGFYYTGVEDKVRCYHCGGGLQKWKSNDDPWLEHAKWFSNCDFVLLVKGGDFMNNVKKSMLKTNSNNGEVGNGSNKTEETKKMDENMLQTLMTSAPVISALELGLDVSRIKQVLQDRLARHQKGFSSEDELIAAVLDAQFDERVADLTEESWIDEYLPRSRTMRTSTVLEYMMEAGASNPNRPVGAINRNEHNDPILISLILARPLEPPEEYTESGTNSEDEGESESMVIGSPSQGKSFTEFVSEKKSESTEEAKDPQILKEENRKLKEAKLCKICMDRDVNIVFLPCGHLISCSSCAANIPDCPVCRQMIKGTVRTFLA